MKKILILDYGWGNLRSVYSAVKRVGGAPEVASAPEAFTTSVGLIIPGVGAFPHGMRSLEEAHLVEPIRKFVATGRPVLGICLGMQLLFEQGQEFEATPGLGVIPGKVRRLAVREENCKLPHIGWAEVIVESDDSVMFGNIDGSQRRYYFLHSFAATDVPPEYVVGRTNYAGEPVIAAVRCGNVWGTQFHPEKSGPNGLRLLSNFVDCVHSR